MKWYDEGVGYRAQYFVLIANVVDLLCLDEFCLLHDFDT
jgi:hypothetical protein